jgi:hypothetical protein
MKSHDSSDFSRMKNQKSMDSFDIHTPPHVFSDESLQLFKRAFEDYFAALEKNPDQQKANMKLSGPGRSHFSPSDRQRSESHYAPSVVENTLHACMSAIGIHQMMYGIDPCIIRVSHRMYFILSTAVVDFRGHLIFTGIFGCDMRVSVDVYSDTSTDVIVCVH